MLEIFCSIVLVFLFLMHPPAVGSTGSFSKLKSTDLSGPHPALSRCHFPSQLTLLSKRGFSVPPPFSVPSTPFKIFSKKLIIIFFYFFLLIFSKKAFIYLTVLVFSCSMAIFLASCRTSLAAQTVAHRPQRTYVSIVVAYRLHCSMAGRILTRDQTSISCISRWILNHWTIQEVLSNSKSCLWVWIGACAHISIFVSVWSTQRQFVVFYDFSSLGHTILFPKCKKFMYVFVYKRGVQGWRGK